MFLILKTGFKKKMGFLIFNFCSKTNLMEESNPSLETQESVVLEDDT